MKWVAGSSLRTRLCALLVFAMVPLLVLFCFDAHSQYRRESATLDQEVLRLAAFIAGDVEQLLESSRQLLVSVTSISCHSGPDTRDRLLLDLSRQCPFIAHFGAASAAGEVLCATASGMDASSLIDDEILRRAIQSKEVVIGRFRVHYLGNKDVLTIAYRSEEEKPAGSPVIGFAVLDFGWLDYLLSEERVTGRMSLFPREMVLNVLDRSGTILTRYPDRGSWVGKTIVDTPIFNAIREKREGTADLSGVDGVMRSYTFAGVKGSSGDLFVNVGVAKHAALAPVMRALYLKLAALLAIGVSVFLAVWISSVFLVARPVGTLVDTTRRLAEGDLSTRSRLAGGPREMMELAHSFDQMAESLEDQEGDRQDTHAKLLEYDRQLRQMTVELSLAEEQERKQVASELHDNVGPLLATAFMKLGRALKLAVPPRAATLLTEIRQHLDQAIQQTQTLTFDLSSPLLYTLGLPSALEQLCRDVAADHALMVKFRGDERARDLTSDQRIILYRAARELLYNVVKHAEAEHVTVVCICNEKEVGLRVRDDGVGFDAILVGQGFSRTGGFGLFNLRERFIYLGGRFAVESSQGSGTQVAVALPVSSAEREDRKHEGQGIPRGRSQDLSTGPPSPDRGT